MKLKDADFQFFGNPLSKSLISVTQRTSSSAETLSTDSSWLNQKRCKFDPGFRGTEAQSSAVSHARPVEARRRFCSSLNISNSGFLCDDKTLCSKDQVSVSRLYNYIWQSLAFHLRVSQCWFFSYQLSNDFWGQVSKFRSSSWFLDFACSLRVTFELHLELQQTFLDGCFFFAWVENMLTANLFLCNSVWAWNASVRRGERGCRTPRFLRLVTTHLRHVSSTSFQKCWYDTRETKCNISEVCLIALLSTRLLSCLDQKRELFSLDIKDTQEQSRWDNVYFDRVMVPITQSFLTFLMHIYFDVAASYHYVMWNNANREPVGKQTEFRSPTVKRAQSEAETWHERCEKQTHTQ